MVDYKSCIEIPIKYDRNIVLSNLQVTPNSAIYENYSKDFDYIIEKDLNIIKPIAYICQVKNQNVVGYDDEVLCLLTLGEQVTNRIQRYLSEFDYPKGMLLDALANNIIINASDELFCILTNKYKSKELFLTKRYEPGTNTGIEKLKVIIDTINENYTSGIRLTQTNMILPQKSLAYLYGVIREDKFCGLDHDCSQCLSKHCDMRKYLVNIYEGDKKTIIKSVRKSSNLLDFLRKNNLPVLAPCGGNGTCRKCIAKIRDKEGIRQVISCEYFINSDIDLYVKRKKDLAKIEGDYEEFPLVNVKKIFSKPYALAIDIGTTTIAISLIDLLKQKNLATYKSLNPQASYGADVISRIHFYSKDKSLLTNLIRKRLKEDIDKLLKDNKLKWSQLEKIVISANTVMAYLLMAYDVSPLGVSPFKTKKSEIIKVSSQELFDIKGTDVFLLPWISAYVGGDIVSGIYAYNIDMDKRTQLFIDLGTNGEIVFHKYKSEDDEVFLCASTAAGPAFEGANIKNGMGSIKGAISAVVANSVYNKWTINISDHKYGIETIGSVEPIGICGSGLLDILAILLNHKIISSSGFMEKEYKLTESISIYPQDIRELQLSKSAINAGAKSLMERGGSRTEEVERLLIAGGFGRHINIDNAARIGLFDKELKNKVTCIGNSSLAGAVKFLLDEDGVSRINKIIKKIKNVDLSSDMKFYDMYIEGMQFDE